MSDSAHTWEAALFRRLLGRRWLALLLVVSLQAILVLALAALLWVTRVKDTFVAQAQTEPASGLVVASVSPRDLGKLEVGRPVQLIVETSDGLSRVECEGQVVDIQKDTDAAVATIGIAPGTEGSCVEAKRLLGAGAPTKVILQARTRRLLLLLLGG